MRLSFKKVSAKKLHNNALKCFEMVLKIVRNLMKCVQVLKVSYKGFLQFLKAMVAQSSGQWSGGGRKLFRRWSDQWPFWSGDSLIRGHLKCTIAWAMVAQSSGQWSGGGRKLFRRWSAQWLFWSGDSLIRGHLTHTIVWTMVWVSSGLWLHNRLAVV